MIASAAIIASIGLRGPHRKEGGAYRITARQRRRRVLEFGQRAEDEAQVVLGECRIESVAGIVGWQGHRRAPRGHW
jgi:hypothetical protein